MAAWSKCIKFGRCGSRRSGEARSPAGLSRASRCSSSKRTGISQNSRVSGEESLMVALTVSFAVFRSGIGIQTGPGTDADLIGRARAELLAEDRGIAQLAVGF